jgi:hypothetical protein
VEAEIGRHQVARDRLDPAGIAAEQEGRHLLVDDGLDGLRAAEALAEAGQPVLGLDLHPDQVGALGDADGAETRDLRQADLLFGTDACWRG